MHSLSAGVVAMAAMLPMLAQAAPSTLVYCSENSPNGFQPALYSDLPTMDASSRALYDRLVDFKPGSTEVVPALAESWQISGDGLRYTFHLRRGVNFHSNFGFTPTRELDADDVLFTFQRMADSQHPYHAVSGGSYPYYVSMGLPKLLRAVRKLDAHTVQFELSEPNAPFLADMAMDFASVASAEYAQQLLRQRRQQDFDLKPIGSGPFQLQAYQAGTMIRYQAFPAYWRGKAGVDQLVFAINPNPSVRWAKMRAGECQAMAYPNPAELPAMRADPRFKVLAQPGQNVSYLAFNMEKKPLDDARVRRALSMAVDKKAIIDAVFQGSAQQAQGLLPPTLWSYDPQQHDWPYDPQQARQLLAEAGHADGFKLELWALPSGHGGLNPDSRRTAVMIQSDWARIGVKAEIVGYEWGEYLRRLGKGEHQAALMGWVGDNGDPDNFLGLLLDCRGVHTPQNLSEFCQPEYQQLIEQAVRSSDPAERTRIYRRMQAMLHQQQPLLALAHVMNTVVLSTRVQGFVVDAFGGHRFWGVSLR